LNKIAARWLTHVTINSSIINKKTVENCLNLVYCLITTKKQNYDLGASTALKIISCLAALDKILFRIRSPPDEMDVKL